MLKRFNPHKCSSPLFPGCLTFLRSMQHIGDFNYPRLADFGAAISGANKLQCQEVLEELDVSSSL